MRARTKWRHWQRCTIQTAPTTEPSASLCCASCGPAPADALCMPGSREPGRRGSMFVTLLVTWNPTCLIWLCWLPVPDLARPVSVPKLVGGLLPLLAQNFRCLIWPFLADALSTSGPTLADLVAMPPAMPYCRRITIWRSKCNRTQGRSIFGETPIW